MARIEALQNRSPVPSSIDFGKYSSIERGRYLLALMITISGLLIAPADAAQSELSEAEREAIKSELQVLQEQLAVLRNNRAVKLDQWADANVFVKGVSWALDPGPIENAQDRELLQSALRRARERVEALKAGRSTWKEKKGRTIRGFVSDVDGSTQPYGLVVPASYDSSKPMRLDVVLHGSTGTSGMAELRFIRAYDGGDEEDPKLPATDYIELHPMGRLGENAYRFEGETDVDEAIAAVCRNYRIDKTRVVLRGSSLGGVGTWQLGLKRPDRYVALGPTAGPVDTFEFANSPWPHFVRLDPLTPWQETMLHMVDAIDYTANASMVPVVPVMGDQDHYFSSHLLIQKAFEKEGIPFNGFVDEGAGHNVSAAARQKQLDILGEYAAKGLPKWPDHIRFVTWTLKFSRCHWIEILGLQQHYQRSEIDARLADDGSITVSNLKNISRFAIRLQPDHNPAASITIDGTVIVLHIGHAGVTRRVEFELKDGLWHYQREQDGPPVPLSGKRPGLQGPIDDAFTSPFLCVRGTGQPRNAAVGNWADASLRRFANEWRRHYRGDLPIKNDTDVTAEDRYRFNLILFGDPGSNELIRHVLNCSEVREMPVKWTRDVIQLGSSQYSAAEHGLQMIFPSPFSGFEDRYVVFNSGHTYHDSELRFSYMVFPRLGDWAITKVGQNPSDNAASKVDETVLQSGFFDESWKIPSVQFEKRETTVSIVAEKFTINGQPTYKGRSWQGRPIEGLLLNSRMVQATFDDRNAETASKWAYPDTKKWDANRNTAEFIEMLPIWRKHGLLAVTLNLQGGSPEGYSKDQPWYNSAINSDGTLDQLYMKRLEQVIDKADQLGMVVILGLYYFGQDQRVKDEQSVITGVDAATDWLVGKRYTNVLVEVNNECDVKSYDHAILKPERVHELIERVQKRSAQQNHRLLVGTSYGGKSIPRPNVVKVSDFLLLHGNGVSEPQKISEMVKQTRLVEGYRPMPILFNEDDHFDFDQPNNNFSSAISEYASWGYFDYRKKNESFDEGYQSVPVNWTTSSVRKKGFFKLLSEIAGEQP